MLNTRARLLASLGTLALAAFLLPGVQDAQAQAQLASVDAVPLAIHGLATQGAAQTQGVDESALYYYAQNNQHGRVDSEIRRLQALHPQWSPPADLYQGGVYNRDRRLWDMFAAQEIGAIHEEIARRVAQEPGWQPPLELTEALDRAERRRGVLSASAAGNSQAILAALEADPALLDENDLEVVWAAGSAYAREGRVSRASALFDLGVRAARDDAELRGTLYKARDVLPMQPVQALLATAQTLHAARAGHRAVIEQFQLDLLRDELGAQLEAWRLEPDSTHPLNHQAMGAIEASWQDGQGLGSDTARRAADYELLGWAWFAQGDNDRSLALFRQAMAIAPSGIAATADGNSPTLQGAAHYGAALALRRSGDGEASLGLLAQAFTDSSGPGNRGDDRLMALYVETLGDALYGLESAVDLTLERVAQYTQFVSQLEDAPGAQALGWYAYRGQQFIPAAAWFAKSLEWRASQSAAEGLVRSTWQLGQHEEARQLLEHHAALFPELSSLSIELAEPVTRQAVAGTARQSQSTRASSAVASAAQAQRAGDPRRCLSLLEGTRPSEEATLIGAWCLMDLGRPHEAATQFATVIAGLSQANSRDAGYGLALAMLRQGRTFDALDIARDTDLSEEQRAMIARSALADQANQAFNARHYGDAIAALDRRQRFAAEPRDLTLLRAWSLLRLNATQEARALFLMLDQQLSTRETQQGLGAVPSAQAAWMSN